MNTDAINQNKRKVNSILFDDIHTDDVNNPQKLRRIDKMNDKIIDDLLSGVDFTNDDFEETPTKTAATVEITPNTIKDDNIDDLLCDIDFTDDIFHNLSNDAGNISVTQKVIF